MNKVRVELNLAGINEMMKSPEIQAQLQKAGDMVANAAGDDYAATTDVINWIAITNVYPNSKDAAHDNFENNSLLRAVGSVGLPMRE